MGFLDMLGLGGGEVQPQAAQPSMDAVVNGAPEGAPVQGPPANPQELQQRQAGWKDFITKLQTDPAMKQAAFHVATQLMQPMPQGQTTLGHIGKALGGGQLYLQMMQQNQLENDRKAAEAKSQQEYRAAQTEQTKQETAQKAELFPQTKAKLEQDLANARTDAEIKKARLAIDQFNSDPARMAENLKLDQGRVRAQTAASYASAEEHKAGALLKKTQGEAADFALGTMSDEEKKGVGTQLVTGTKGARAAMAEKIAAYEDLFGKTTEGQRKAGETDQQFSQRRSDWAATQVTKAAEAEKIKAAQAILSDMTADEADRTAARQYLAGQLQGKPAAGGGGGATPKRAWDPATGNVLVDGVVVGKAASAAEAKAMLNKK